MLNVWEIKSCALLCRSWWLIYPMQTCQRWKISNLSIPGASLTSNNDQACKEFLPLLQTWPPLFILEKITLFWFPCNTALLEQPISIIYSLKLIRNNNMINTTFRLAYSSCGMMISCKYLARIRMEPISVRKAVLEGCSWYHLSAQSFPLISFKNTVTNAGKEKEIKLSWKLKMSQRVCLQGFSIWKALEIILPIYFSALSTMCWQCFAKVAMYRFLVMIS